MAPPPDITVDSLGAAVEAFMNAPNARRSVVVSSVEVAHSAALLAFLDFQEQSGLWEILNAGRLHELATIDRLFGAIVIDVLPVLVADPTSPTLALLSRYSVYIESSAHVVGGNFEHRAATICHHMIAYADNTSRRPGLSAAELLRRLEIFRSERVTIADTNTDGIDGMNVLAWMASLDHIHLSSFRRLASFRQDFIDSPPAEHVVTVDALPTSHSSALLGVMTFEGVASGWIVRNLTRLRAMANVNDSLEFIGLGLLPFLDDNPTNQPARYFLLEYVRGVRERVRDVGGEFVTHATHFCDSLIANATRSLPPPQMRRDLDVFRSRDMFIHHSDNTDDESTSGSSEASDSPEESI